MSNIYFNPWGSTQITTQQALSDQTDIFKNVFNKTPNLSPSSPTGALIQELTDMEVNVNNTCVYITSNVYGLNTTQGIFLDGIGNLFGIERIPAFPSIVACQMFGTPGVTVNNAIVSDGTHQYVCNTAFTFNSSGGATAIFVCTTLGQVAVSANTVNIILTPTTGWSSVNNHEAGITGSNIQNDTAYRFTLQYAQAQNGRGFVTSLYSILTDFVAQDGSTTIDVLGNNIPYIQGFYVYSNYTNTAQTIVSGLDPIPVGGVYITIYAPQYLSPTNPNINANLQYIAGLILNQIGANTTNNIQTLSTNRFNVNYVNKEFPNINNVMVNFDSPIETPIQFSYTIKLYVNQQSANNLSLAVKNAILNQFYNGYSNGSTIYKPAQMNAPINTADYIASIINVVGGCTIISQDIRLVTGGVPGTSLTLTVDKIATLSLANINITFT